MRMESVITVETRELESPLIFKAKVQSPVLWLQYAVHDGLWVEILFKGEKTS